MVPRPQRMVRDSILCCGPGVPLGCQRSWRSLWAPLGSLPSAVLNLLDPSSLERQKEKLLSKAPPFPLRLASRCLSCAASSSCAPATWQSPWSLWGVPEAPETESLFLRFENQTQTTVQVLWFSDTGEEKPFYKLQPSCSITQETYSGNVWLVREDNHPGKRLLKRVKVVGTDKERLLCCIRPVPAEKAVDPTEDTFACPDARIPACYTRVVETEMGIPVVGDSDVSMAALHAAADIIRSMLQGCKPYIAQQLRRHQCKVAIIGRNKATTDILEHSHLRGSNAPDGRDWDTQVRGLGGTMVIPTCSVGEENVLRCKNDKFGKESILVHEFGHTVMEIALSTRQQQRIKDCFLRNKHRYKPGIYMVADEKEYWAEGAESWFNASLREDVNDGINTREKLWKHDPELASLLREVFGLTSWRYDFTPVSES